MHTVLLYPFRSIYLTYKKGVELEGIPLYRFTPPPELWMYEDHPENECFCVGDVCPHPGIFCVLKVFPQ